MGAARLAQICVDGGRPEEVCAAPPVAHRIAPDPDLAARLAPKRAAFIDAYPRITPLNASRNFP
jgi:xylulokinase